MRTLSVLLNYYTWRNSSVFIIKLLFDVEKLWRCFLFERERDCKSLSVYINNLYAFSQQLLPSALSTYLYVLMLCIIYAELSCRQIFACLVSLLLLLQNCNQSEYRQIDSNFQYTDVINPKLVCESSRVVLFFLYMWRC